MKANIALEQSVTNKKDCYIVINDAFRIKINTDLWHELADFLGIKVEVEE